MNSKLKLLYKGLHWQILKELCQKASSHAFNFPYLYLWFFSVKWCKLTLQATYKFVGKKIIYKHIKNETGYFLAQLHPSNLVKVPITPQKIFRPINLLIELGEMSQKFLNLVKLRIGYHPKMASIGGKDCN